jgi:hypothetical protein
MFKSIKILLFSSFFILFPLVSKASTLYLDPASSQYGPGDSFNIDVKLAIDSSCVNTVEATIDFPKDYLQMVDFLIGDSIINLWLDKPNPDTIGSINAQGQMHFSGGTPGGYCGKIPGDPGESNIVARLIFKVSDAKTSGSALNNAIIKFASTTRVLLNDGFGTEDKLTIGTSSITILSTSSPEKSNWKDIIKSDKTLPEPFVIELQSLPNIYNGKYFINFYTTDKESGIDRYEILEIRPNEKIGEKPLRSAFDYIFGFFSNKPPLNWEKAEIPYLLKDQTLLSTIHVKAIDKAGNERLVDFVPPKSEQEKVQTAMRKVKNMVILLLGGMLIILTGLTFLTVRMLRKRKTIAPNNNNNK